MYQNNLSIGQAVWFVENILKVKFNLLSESQAKYISSFSRSVGEMVTKHIEQTTRSYCAGCQANFNGHHKKCFPAPNHSCQVRKRTMSCSNSSEQLVKEQANCYTYLENTATEYDSTDRVTSSCAN